MGSPQGTQWQQGLGRHPRLVEALLVVAIAIPALQAKLARLGSFATGPDGSLYMDVAHHLLAGDGLVTNLSLYHQGYTYLPHPTSVQPLWPVLLAAAGKVMPLTTAAVAVPTALWVLSLALGFVWGRRLAPNLLPVVQGWRAPDGLLHGGHVVLALLALAPDFASFTSRPYTEGISFSLLFGCLLRAPGLFERRTIRAGVELGLWLALLFYARSQLFVVVLAAPCLFVWHWLREHGRRSATARFAAATTASFVVAFLPELLWVGSFVEGSPLLAYLRFDQSGAGTALTPVRGLRAGETLLHTVADRLAGVRVAFGSEGYRTVFGWGIYIVPVALVALAASPRARWRDLCELVDRQGLALVTAVGSALLLHVMHKDVGNEWWFGDRHALMGVLFFVFAYVLCARAGALFAGIAVLLLVGATAVAAVDIWVKRPPRPFRPLQYRIDAQARLLALDLAEPGPLIVAMPRQEARALAWLVPDVGFHGIVEQTTLADLEYMVEKLGVRYVVTVGKHKDAPTTDPRFEECFELVDELYAPKQKPKRKKGKPPKGPRIEDLVRIYAPKFSPDRERGPAE